jgi:SAM-dependent methyltransferase
MIDRYIKPCYYFGQFRPNKQHNATFDKAMTINSHHIWPDSVAGLREVRRTLRAGGRIAIAITRFSYASPDNFESQLLDAGFTEVRLHAGEAGTCALGRA